MDVVFPKTGSRILTTYRYMRDPYRCYREWRAHFGDTFIVNALNGNVVVTCDLENIRVALSATSEQVSQFAVETTAPLVGPSAVILIDGPRHRQERRILSPSFGNACLGHYAPIIQDIAEQSAQRWQPNTTISAMDEALEVSLNVIIRVVFGVTDGGTIAEFRDQIRSFVSSFHPVLAFTRMFQRSWFGLSPWNRFLREKAKLEQMLDREIQKVWDGQGDSQGMLYRILQEYQTQDGHIDRANVRSQLITMLLAGHETTQSAIHCPMSWLHRHPEILESLRQELALQPFQQVVKESRMLDGVCHESLRLNPILPDVVRTLKEPMEWSGVRLPIGTHIGLSTCLVHSDPEVYPEPDRFKPDRWFDWTPKPNQFLPFGGGVRRCLGAPLSLLEMKIVVLHWIKRFEFALPKDAPEVEPVFRNNITMAPKTGIPLTVIKSRESDGHYMDGAL